MKDEGGDEKKIRAKQSFYMAYGGARRYYGGV